MEVKIVAGIWESEKKLQIRLNSKLCSSGCKKYYYFIFEALTNQGPKISAKCFAVVLCGQQQDRQDKTIENFFMFVTVCIVLLFIKCSTNWGRAILAFRNVNEMYHHN